MKTWTNPTVEELDVKLTANGKWNSYWETAGDIISDITNGYWNPETGDYEPINDSLKDKEKTES